MLKFKEFLNEEVDSDSIQVDDRYLRNNLDQLNDELDKLTSKPYQNAPILLAQLRGCLERYGMILPSTATDQFLNLGAELAFGLGESGLYLYIVYDTNDDGYVDGYAQVVDVDELSDLLDLEGEGVLNRDRRLIGARNSDWYRKRDDDAGNSDEY
jgi:hypothetical protein